MALSGDQLEAASRATVELYREAETAILEQITRRLAAGMDSPHWATTRLAQLEGLRHSVERALELARAAGLGLIADALAWAYRAGTAAATVGLPRKLWPNDPDIKAGAAVRGIRADVIEQLAAATVRDIGAKQANVLRHVEDVYRQVIARATAVSVAGGQTRLQASQHAFQQLVDRGVTSFTDSGGRQWRLSSYVEMAVRTVTQRSAVRGQTDRLESLGMDLVMVSDSPRECPTCRPWEGKVLSISGKTTKGEHQMPSVTGGGNVTVTVDGTVDEARQDGLQHPNCTHSLRGYLPGATKRIKPNANPKGYEAKERQREIERNIRKYKEREAAALTPEAKTAAKAKVRGWQAAMRDHLKANPELKRLSYREQPGAGNQPA